ncbi:MAG: hypothetical protein N3A72_10255 [bacterium]|nr:hypothetical protein [bacterium]
MAAIDLLFDWAATSERMHQVVLACLLEKTKLLDKLDIGIKCNDIKLNIETQNRLYDFTIIVDNKKHVHIELKIDAPLEENQIIKQIKNLKNEEMLLYFLIGTTRLKWDKEKILSICKKQDKENVKESIETIGLQELREAVNSLTTNSIDNDLRDLAAAYGTLLNKIEDYTNAFTDKKLAEWNRYDWIGYFSTLNDKFDLGGDWDYVPNRSGGFMGFWWKIPKEIAEKNFYGYLQLEHDKLCWKIFVSEKNMQSKLRNNFSTAVIETAIKLNLGAKKPSRFGLGKTMTVAVFDKDYRSENTDKIDWNWTKEIFKKAELVLEEAKKYLNEQH